MQVPSISFFTGQPIMNKLFIVIFLSWSVTGLAQTKMAYIQAGNKSMEEGDYYTAGTFYQQALAFDDNDEQVIYKIAEACRLYNDYKNASLHYEKHLGMDHKGLKPKAAFYAGEMRKFLGDYTGARKFFEDYVSRHLQDSDYFLLKSKNEIISCDTALRLLSDTTAILIMAAGNTVNTIYNDFGAQQSGDSVLYFSSQRFEETSSSEKNKKSFVSKILKTENNGSTWRSPLPIDRLFNPAGYLNCNSSISADHRLLFFTRCTPVTLSKYHAELYFSKWEKGKWQNPVKAGKEINNRVYTSTQPALAADGAEGYILYFSSDRPGGYGGMDLWKSKFRNGQFSPPENLGPMINTRGDEITPFFDNLSGILYFSSDWHAGLGGFDIFQSVLLNGNFSIPLNMGYPLNSSCNDLYFTVTHTGKDGLFTSNRPGSMFLYTQTCCYDIFRYEIPGSAVAPRDSSYKLDSLMHAEIRQRIADSAALTVYLPLKLYFDNDQPGPRSLDTVTKKTYEATYLQYQARKMEYLDAFTREPGADSIQAAVRDFFQRTLEKTYQDLDTFSSSLLYQLKQGRKIELTIQGCASPLAKGDYNVNLSRRRISSLVNFLSVYQQGEIATYIRDGSLELKYDPAGESLAAPGVSDNLNDKRNSVYHPKACLERRIEVTGVRFLN